MWGGGTALLQIPLMQVAQQRLPVGTVAAVSQRIVVNRTVKIGREFRQYGEDAVRLPQFEQQFLNEVLGRSGTAHKRCGVGAEGLVVTDVKFLPGSGVFPVDPGYEIFSLGPLHLHNYMSPPPGNRDERCFTAPKAGLAAKGTVANISILHQYIGNSDIFLFRSNRPYFYIFQLKNGVKTTFIPDSAR